MSTDHLTYEWWVEDGPLDLWVRHLCNGEVKEWHPDSRWHLTVDGPRPSFQCDACGAHTILQACDQRDRLVALGTDVLSLAATREVRAPETGASGPLSAGDA